MTVDAQAGEVRYVIVFISGLPLVDPRGFGADGDEFCTAGAVDPRSAGVGH